MDIYTLNVATLTHLGANTPSRKRAAIVATLYDLANQGLLDLSGESSGKVIQFVKHLLSA